MKNIKQGIKRILDLDSNFTIMEWHIACVDILNLTGITQNDFDLYKVNKPISKALQEGDDNAAALTLCNFCYSSYDGIGGALHVVDIFLHDMKSYVKVKDEKGE